jgi:hypothetical protein
MILRLWACPENFSMSQGCQGYQYLDPDEVFEHGAPRCTSNKGGMLLPESTRVCDRLMVDMGLYDMSFGGKYGGTLPQLDSSVSPGSGHDVRDVPAEVA